MSIHAEKILRKAGDKPNHPRVLLCAFTGKAASLIGTREPPLDPKIKLTRIFIKYMHDIVL